MIERVYMGIDGRRDHSFRIPRPDLSATLGTPNACNDCHRERTAEWAAAEIERRFPHGVMGEGHFATTFSAARDVPRSEAIDAALFDIAEDPGSAGIGRATALDLLRPSASAEHAARAATHLADGDPLVRAAVARLQDFAPEDVRLSRLAPPAPIPSSWPA